ncbi:MAG: TonB family protein [Saprospiraceae bacterium]
MTILSYLLQVTLGLAFFYAFYYAALRKETLFQTNRIYLIATLLTSIILPLIRIYILQLEHADSVPTPSIVYVGSYLETMNITVASEKEGIPWTKVLLTIYLSGIFLLVLRMIREVLVIFTIKRKGELSQINNHLCVLSKEVKSPFSFFNTVFLPADHQFTESELTEIVAHEKAHVTGGHTMDVLFMELACIALWPSPMIYLYRKKLREVHEFLADAAVLKDTPWENYASLLLAQKANNLQSRLTNQLIYSQLKNRLMMMTQQRSGFFARFKYLGLIPILLVSLVIFSFREKTKENSDTPVDEHRIYNIYKDGLPVYVVFDSITLTVTKNKKYLLNSIQVPISQLEQKLNAATHGCLNRNVYLSIVDKTFTVGELSEMLTIIQKLNLTCIMETTIGHAGNDSADTTHIFPWTYVGVKAGNTTLKENEDYQIDYSTGKIKIINEAYLDPEMPINVSFRSDTLPTTTIAAYKLPTEDPGSALSKNISGIEPFTFVEEMPHFPGKNSTELMYKFFSNTIKYPSVSNQNIEGMGIVQFVVEADGSISRIKILRSPNQFITDELMRVMKVMAALPDKWIPGKHNGIAVPVSFTLPVKFVLPPDSKKVELPSAEVQVFQQVEEMPRFPGCEQLEKDKRSACATETMFKYIYQSIKYPQEDRQKGNEGMVVAKFVVEPDGSISNARVVRGASEGLNAEILRVINSMNDLPEKWIPGLHEGKAVPVEFVLPFKFVLQSTATDDKSRVNTEENVMNKQMRIDTSLIFDSNTRKDEIVTTKMSPNPASDLIKIEFSKNVKGSSIFDASGHSIWQKKFDQTEDFNQSIDVSKWAPGIYRVQSLTTGYMHNTTFVVQH